ncbi:hypothetical protein HNP24_003305 [Chryseobacterium sediminis]|uniref:Uncharacterized protein n=1 Tax=Chryseobacterium sediminis TaxID=1679494 RepID=A0ABR6Q5E1_9FLAO|nr:hypothetical protein [Chryseobacterium sediminis]
MGTLESKTFQGIFLFKSKQITKKRLITYKYLIINFSIYTVTNSISAMYICIVITTTT